MANKSITVIIVDDSALVRQAIAKLLGGEPDIAVLGAYGDPFTAAERLRTELPDVLILDVEMPRMDGLTFLQKIMTQRPIPVIICSTLVANGSDTFVTAVDFGAVDVIEKPKVGTRQFFEESKIRICDAVRAAALSNLTKLRPLSALTEKRLTKKNSADVILPATPQILKETTEKIIAIGASTGGTEAIRLLMEEMPIDAPGIVVVQHMPEKFTRLFAERLNGLCAITVKEAEANDSVLRGRALIAPGDRHLILKRSGHRYYVDVAQGPLVNRHRPSVDVLFRSVANNAGRNAVGVILTGMGDDGARGLLEMKKSGAYTIAQDEESCVVYGMPKEAVRHGAVGKVLPLGKISREIIERAIA